MSDTPSLPAQIEAEAEKWARDFCRACPELPIGAENIVAELLVSFAKLVTLQQHERLEATVAELETAYQNCAELAMTYHGQRERLEAVVKAAWRAVEQRPEHSKHMTALYDALRALGTAAPETPHG